MPEPLLQLESLDAGYGAIRAIWGITLRIEPGRVVSLIGHNGAGKTTTLNAIAGLLRAMSGRILFHGEDITRKPSHARVRRHLSLIPEERHLWPRMTVEENLLMGAFPRVLRPSAQDSLERVYAMFPRLKERRRQAAGTLSGGEQQMCAIGRGLMAKPMLLLLDEPALGLAPRLVDEVFRTVRRIADEGVTILIAGQNANYMLEVSDYCYVFESGRISLQGPSATLRSNDHVRRAYLGG
jgi:branched-chain amino acid transport system ATP-binding protein